MPIEVKCAKKLNDLVVVTITCIYRESEIYILSICDLSNAYALAHPRFGEVDRIQEITIA